MRKGKGQKVLWGMIGMVLAISLSAVSAYASDRTWTGNEWNVSEEEMSHVENLKIGREDARSSFFPFSDKDAALNSQQIGQERNLDDAWFQSLDTADGQIWKFYYVPYPGARASRPDNGNIMNPDYDDSGWDEITVPKSWEATYNEDGTFRYNPPQYSNTDYAWITQNPNPRAPHAPTQFNPVGFYRTKIDVDPSFKNRSVFLNFEGVESAFYLWVNGHKVGYSEDSFTSKEFQIDEWLNFDGKDTLAVEVFKWSSGSWFEDQDMLTLAGIFRSVYLVSKDQVEIRDFTINTVKTGNGTNPKEDYRDFNFELYASLRALGGKDTLEDGMKADVVLYDPQGNEVKADALSDMELEKTVNAADFTGTDSFGRPTVTVKLSATVKNPLKWSAESPNLYKALITLSDSSGKLIETTAYRFGFRMVEIKNQNRPNAQILINGQPLLLKGVNVHENNYETGRAMTYELIKKDVTMMKQNNFNAIRMSHYSHDFRYYDLADEFGLYICDEANIETHGNRSIPSNNQKYLPAVLDRLSSMFYRSKNFPSVIILSLGNEAGSGTVFGEMNKWLKGNYTGTPDFYIDETLKGDIQGRPVHYEGDNGNADVKSNMYPGVDSVLNESNVNKPYILCEYSHAMGTSGGYYQDYWNAFESKENIQGGFIWDWVDQSIKTYVAPEAFPAQTDLGWQSGDFVSQDQYKTKVTPKNGPECRENKGSDGAEGTYALNGAAVAGVTPQELNLNSSFTLEVWAYPKDTGTSSRTMVAKGDNQYKLQTVNGTIQFNTFYHGWNECVYQYDADNWANQWHHIVAVYDASAKTAKLYCDDMETPKTETVFEKVAEDGSFGKSSSNFAVGFDTQNNGRAWEGLLDNVRVYNTALTEEDLAKERSASDANVVYWEDFEEEPSSGTADISYRVYTLRSQDALQTPCTLIKKDAALKEEGVSKEEGDHALTGPAVVRNTPAALDLNGTMTLEAWVYPTDDSGQRVVIGKGDTQFVLRTQNGSLCLQTYSEEGSKWNQLLCKYGDNWIGNWHHVAVTYDAATREAKMYIDDMSIPAGETVFANVYEDGTFLKNGESFAVGRETNNLGRDWRGKIDNARVYSRALTAEELQDDSRSASDDGVVFWMDFNGTAESEVPVVSEGYMGFGGDWGDSPNSSNFCANGIVSTDRIPHGAMLDIKRVHQDYVMQLKGASLDAAEVEIRSRALFTDASAYDFVWNVKEDGAVIRTGKQTIELEPLAVKTISITYDEIAPKKGSNYYIEMKFVLKSDTAWAKAGHEISAAQANLLGETGKIEAETLDHVSKLSYEQTQDAYTVTGEEFSLVFDRKAGTMKSFVFKGTEIFAQDAVNGPAPNFWRAPTDGDRLSNISTSWRYAGQNRTNIETEMEEIPGTHGRAVKIHVAGDLALSTGSAAYTADFTIYGDGQVLVENSVVPEGLSDRDLIPSIGNEMQLAKQFENLTWFGRGSDQEGLFSESFADRYEKQFIDLYEDQVEKQFIPYIRNQTFGNKMDISWAAFTNENGKGLLISSKGELLNINAQHYTQEELTSFGSKHPYESRRTENVVVNLDYKNMAVGYDPGWLDKRWYKEEDIIRPTQTFSWQYKLSPLDSYTPEEAFAVSRQSYNTEDLAQVNAVIAMIAALPEAEALTREDTEAVEAAEAAYLALSEEQKAKVTNADKLEEAVAQIAVLNIGKIAKEVRAAADAAKADAQTAADAAESAQENAQAAKEEADAAALAAKDAADKAIEAEEAAKAAKEEADAAKKATGEDRKAAEDALEKAQIAQQAAVTAKNESEIAKKNAEDAAKTAELARQAAETAEQNAKTAQGKAEDAQKAAQSAADAADLAKTDALGAKDAAEKARTDAITAQTEAGQAKDGAVRAQEEAKTAMESAKADAASAKASKEAAAAEAVLAKASQEAAKEYAAEAIAARDRAEKAAQQAEEILKNAQAQADQKLAEAKEALAEAQKYQKGLQAFLEKAEFETSRVSISSLKAGKKKVKVSWKKVKGAEGYVVQCASHPGFCDKKSVTVKNAKAVSKTVKGLKSKKTCYVRVRAYKTIDGKKIYTKFSAKKKVRVK